MCLVRVNYPINLIHNTKRNHFRNLTLKSISGNRKFWKTIKSYFGNKKFNSSKYLLFQKDVLVSNKGKTAKKFNEHFINISLKLKIRNFPNSSNKCNTNDKLIEKFKFRCRILKIKYTFDSLNYLMQGQTITIY